MGRHRKTFVSDYEHAGETLVVICKSCERTAILSYRELSLRGQHMRTLQELERILRCRNCRKKTAMVRVAGSIGRPQANRH